MMFAKLRHATDIVTFKRRGDRAFQLLPFSYGSPVKGEAACGGCVLRSDPLSHQILFEPTYGRSHPCARAYATIRRASATEIIFPFEGYVAKITPAK
jgi:hypothetical protein